MEPSRSRPSPHLALVYPEQPGVISGNRVTAERWAAILGELGCTVDVEPTWSGADRDGLIALHAAKSGDSIERFRRRYPERPLVVAGTGTDLYAHEGPAREVRSGFERASHIVLLQSNALTRLEPRWQDKARVIYQSVELPDLVRAPGDEGFDALLLAHIRPVKDTELAPRAVELLPPDSRVRILHAGAGLREGAVERARAASERVPGYVYLGPLDHDAALRRMAAAHLVLNTSRDEGGAATLSEALALGLPILATDIPGNTGLLGDQHPGLFAPGDAAALASLLRRAETDPDFLKELEHASAERAWLTSRTLERESWRRLLDLPPVASDSTA